MAFSCCLLDAGSRQAPTQVPKSNLGIEVRDSLLTPGSTIRVIGTLGGVAARGDEVPTGSPPAVDPGGVVGAPVPAAGGASSVPAGAFAVSLGFRSSNRSWS